MHKKAFVWKLENLLSVIDSSSQKGITPGQRTLLQFLVHHFKALDVSSDEENEYPSIEPHLPNRIVSALEELRTSADPEVALLRRAYEAETKHDVPNIIDIGASDFHVQSSVVDFLGSMLRDITRQNEIKDRMDKLCGAQPSVLGRWFSKFVDQVHQKGMGRMIGACETGGMSGVFGNTRLSVTIFGGLKFSFMKGDSKEGIIFFTADENDPFCRNTVIEAARTDFRIALDLIEDVITHWPKSEEDQEKVFLSYPRIAAVA